MTSKEEIRDWVKINWPWIVLILLVVPLLILGIVLISTQCYTLIENRHEENYMDCLSGPSLQTKCRDKLEVADSCVCYVNVKLTSDFRGLVTLYYRLDNFTQAGANYTNSRDNNQLAGVLSENVSPDCGDYSYDNTTGINRPIAPCGAVADSMFSDTILFSIIENYEPKLIPYISYGLISEEDKRGFKNPPGNLTEAFGKFAKPKSWTKHIYELNKADPRNNGFENEAFIAWMRTDWKLKPLLRLNNSKPGFEQGLMNGSYQFRITYRNAPNRYRGPRTIVIKSEYVEFNRAPYVIGILSILAGLILGITSLLYILYGKKYMSRVPPSEQVPRPNSSQLLQ